MEITFNIWMDKGVDEPVGQGLDDWVHVCQVLLAEGQSSSQPGGPTRKHRSLVEAEPQWYRVVCDSTHRDIFWIGAMRWELRGLVDNNTFDTAELSAGRKSISAQMIIAWKTTHIGEVLRGKARLEEMGFCRRRGPIFWRPSRPLRSYHTLSG